MAVSHQYSMWQIASWIAHWQAQHIRDKAPYISPASEYGGPPTWWHYFYTQWDWWNNFYANYVPTPSLINLACRGTWRLIGLWVDEVGDWAKDTAQDVVRGWIGYVKYGLVTFSDWIYWLEGVTGIYVPWWALSLADAATRLHNWLPSDIRSALISWYDKFLGWYNAANAWALGQFQAARNWVANTAPWLLTGYNTVRAWYDNVANWVTNFRNDPYGTVVGWLGGAWTAWTGVCTGIVDFYNNVWQPFKVDVFAFFDHPMLFLYDKVEDYLCERW